MQPLKEILNEIEELSADRPEVYVDDIFRKLGEGAFGPALLTLGIISISPVGDIPGVPAFLSVFIILVGGQLALGRERFWLPQFLLKRPIKAQHLRKIVRFLRPVARVVGRIIWRRLAFLTTGPFARAIGGVCTLLALTLPPLEFIPFGATAPSSAITAFSLALVANDGLLASLALILTATTVYLVATAIAGLG